MRADDKVKHTGRPAEPWGRPGQRGVVLRVTPGYRTIPAQAFVQWDDGDDGFTTWEKQADLVAA